MLVILIREQLITPQKVCKTCLLADKSGQPRWQKGKLLCGHYVGRMTEHQPDWYECMMGFHIANIE